MKIYTPKTLANLSTQRSYNVLIFTLIIVIGLIGNIERQSLAEALQVNSEAQMADNRELALLSRHKVAELRYIAENRLFLLEQSQSLYNLLKHI